MPKISAIVPVYNTEAYLPKCLDSILNQTFSDLEIILVNDGSTDHSQQIIEEYASRYPEFIRAVSQKNGGLSAARNTGLSIACGEYISFVDSDDYLVPDAYEKTYRYAKIHDLDVVCFNFFQVINGAVIPATYRFCEHENCRKQYILNEITAWSKLIRTRILTDNHLRFTENRFYEDLELMPQLALYTDKIGFIDDPLYCYLMRDNSIMHQSAYNPKLQSIFGVMETLKLKFYGTDYGSELEYLYISHFLHDAALRFLPYRKGEQDIKQIASVMRELFPKWRSNPYYRGKSWKYKIVCNLLYHRRIRLTRWLLGVKHE